MRFMIEILWYLFYVPAELSVVGKALYFQYHD